MKTPSAFGAPGIEPRWSSSAKEGVGTAYHSGSHVWFTLSHGIVNEVYYPHVDSPNTRDLQFLITDGETFCHEERRDLVHQIEYPEPNALLYRLTNSDPGGRYRLIKEVIGEPHTSVLIINTRLEILEPALRDKLRVYVLLAPHVKGTGRNNSARFCEIDGRKTFHVWRDGIHLVLGGAPDFTRRSIGFVGSSDGWQDLMDNYRMDWEFDEALDGNIALTAEIDLSTGLEFTVALAFGRSEQSASTKLLQALATPFTEQRAKYVGQWQRTRSDLDVKDHTGDGGVLWRLSQCVLLAHEDKLFPGAFVASLSIPWGEARDDSDQGGYHLVWTRDMVHTASALMASGHRESPLRALIWLACVQEADGRLPQNSSIAGKAYWLGTQLDEVAMPIVLAWRVRRAGALRHFDPWVLVSRAARYLILHGPVTAQERWEENSGYSPSTLATIIAALVCAAEFANERRNDEAAKFLLAYADWLAAHLEEWTVTSRGELVPGHARHFLRITPADPLVPGGPVEPDEAMLQVANGGGLVPARNVVSGDFIHLVRLGVRAADDPLVQESMVVIDRVLKRDLPQGPGWRRYNHDGYGQKPDGAAYDGTGEGRVWPILAGERGHYELAAGRDPLAFILAQEKFANAGGMLPEQVWDADDLPDGTMRRGAPTGAAMPLCWAHAEYLTLVRSRRDGVGFDRIDPVYERYARGRTGSEIEMWTLVHQPKRIRPDCTLRIITGRSATVRWSFDGWATSDDVETTEVGLGCAFVDLPAGRLPVGARIVFAILWPTGWEGQDFAIEIVGTVGAGGRSDQ